MEKKVLEDWRKATGEVTRVFVEKYFAETGNDSYWVNDKVGTIFFINDLFFSVDRMIEALELGAKYEHLSQYNDLMVLGDPPISFSNFVKYGNIIDE